jgi:hypothetical protein
VFCELLDCQGPQVSGAGVSLSLKRHLKRIDLGRYRPMFHQLLASFARCLWLGLAASALSICAALVSPNAICLANSRCLLVSLTPWAELEPNKDCFNWYCLECFFYLVLWSASLTFPGLKFCLLYPFAQAQARPGFFAMVGNFPQLLHVNPLCPYNEGSSLSGSLTNC